MDYSHLRLIIVATLFYLALISYVLYRGYDLFKNRWITRHFQPHSSPKKSLEVTGLDKDVLERLVHDFKDKYEKHGLPAYETRISGHTDGGFTIEFPGDIHPKLFALMVNYLTYPFDIDLNSTHIQVLGHATIDSEFAGTPTELRGQSAVVYVPVEDTLHNIVLAKTNDGTFMSTSLPTFRWRLLRTYDKSYEPPSMGRGA